MSTSPMRRWLLAGGGWLLTVVVATAVATGAVGSLGRGVFGTSDDPLTDAEVAALLASSTPGPMLSPQQPQATAAAVRALATTGGTILAACDGGLVTLRSWTPAAGFEADHVARGPAAVASLRFKARSGGGDVRAEVTCEAGDPRLALVDD